MGRRRFSPVHIGRRSSLVVGRRRRHQSLWSIVGHRSRSRPLESSASRSPPPPPAEPSTPAAPTGTTTSARGRLGSIRGLCCQRALRLESLENNRRWGPCAAERQCVLRPRATTQGVGARAGNFDNGPGRVRNGSLHQTMIPVPSPLSAVKHGVVAPPTLKGGGRPVCPGGRFIAPYAFGLRACTVRH